MRYSQPLLKSLFTFSKMEHQLGSFRYNQPIHQFSSMNRHRLDLRVHSQSLRRNSYCYGFSVALSKKNDSKRHFSIFAKKILNCLLFSWKNQTRLYVQLLLELLLQHQPHFSHFLKALIMTSSLSHLLLASLSKATDSYRNLLTLQTQDIHPFNLIGLVVFKI